MDRYFGRPRSGMRNRTSGPGALLRSGIAFAVFSLCSQAQALGVSRPATLSSLGQPLNLLFSVGLGPDEALQTECVRAEVLAGDARIAPALLQLVLEGEARTRFVRLRSLVQIDEPIVTVNLSIACPGVTATFTRQFTAFIDPPNLKPLPVVAEAPAPASTEGLPRNIMPVQRTVAQPEPSAPAPAASNAAAAPPESPAMPAAAPAMMAVASPAPAAATHAVLVAAAEPKAAAPAAASRAVAQAPQIPASKATAPSRPAPKPAVSAPAKLAEAPREAPAAPAPAPAVAQAGAARLKMDPLEIVLDKEAPAAAPALADAASAPDPAMERLKNLEEQLAQVRKDNLATQEKMLTLRGELESAGRYQKPLLIALAALIAGLGGLSLYLWHSRRRERSLRDSVWWNEREEETRGLRLERPTRESLTMALVEPPRVPAAIARRVPDAPPPQQEQEDFEERTVSGVLMEVEEPLPASEPAPPASSPAPVAPTASFMHVSEVPELSLDSIIEEGAYVTVEELIDLEQQVDFFQVLGQDEAGIDLLQRHVNIGVASALPYLKLMEIFQRRGEEFAFVGLGQQYAERFKALPPAWDADLNQGRGLDDYPRVLQRVQNLWFDSGASMALVQRLLSHGSADEQDHVQGFDLPAYRDLLMLYTVARDLSEREVRSSDIDLFLPLDVDSDEASSMMATMVWQTTPKPLSSSVDVDLSGDDEEEENEPTTPARLGAV